MRTPTARPGARVAESDGRSDRDLVRWRAPWPITRMSMRPRRDGEEQAGVRVRPGPDGEPDAASRPPGRPRPGPGPAVPRRDDVLLLRHARLRQPGPPEPRAGRLVPRRVPPRPAEPPASRCRPGLGGRRRAWQVRATPSATRRTCRTRWRRGSTRSGCGGARSGRRCWCGPGRRRRSGRCWTRSRTPSTAASWGREGAPVEQLERGARARRSVRRGPVRLVRGAAHPVPADGPRTAEAFDDWLSEGHPLDFIVWAD